MQLLYVNALYEKSSKELSEILTKLFTKLNEKQQDEFHDRMINLVMDVAEKHGIREV